MALAHPVDRFVILKKLGEGTFGVVYHAYCPGCREEVAVKIVKNIGPETRRLAMREVAVLAKLKHDNVVRVNEFDFERPEPVIVFEYCSGGTTAEYAATNAVSPEDVASILAAVADALSHLHSAGGFHRDIKPQNILLAPAKDGLVVKLADFGLARLPFADDPMTHRLGGTRPYIAPELYSNAPFTGAADIYALGLTGICLLTGEPRAELLRAVPERLEVILRQMLSPVPSERPTAAEVHEALISFVSSPAVPRPRESNLLKYLAVGAAIAGVLGAVGAVVYAAKKGDAE